jgi:phosphoadenosine phosphosulfate reductase
LSMDVFGATSRLLSQNALAHQAVLVAYSGGKDSLVVLDLCAGAFERVVAGHLDFLPGLEVTESRLRYAQERWKCRVLRYPHGIYLRALKCGLYCPPVSSLRRAEEWSNADVWHLARQDSGIALVATGEKKRDFLARRGFIKSNRDPNLIFPLADWHNADVLAYLQHHNIPVPDAPADHSGVDLSTKSLLWLHDHHPDDFALMAEQFPFIETVVLRREWYDVSPKEAGTQTTAAL